jgi:hypothetical protein
MRAARQGCGIPIPAQWGLKPLGGAPKVDGLPELRWHKIRQK